MKTTELDRIYIIGTLDGATHVTHLCYRWRNVTWTFCNGLPYEPILVTVKPTGSAEECGKYGTRPSVDYLEEGSDYYSGVSCPECLAVARSGEIPKPQLKGHARRVFMREDTITLMLR